MRVLLILGIALATCHAKRYEMLETNRVPPREETGLEELWDVCTECKMVIHKLVEVLDDPKKLAELKLVLHGLCSFSSMPEACELVVSKLDVIIKRLEPHIKDAEAVCKEMRLCANPRLAFFHRVGLLKVRAGITDVESGLSNLVCDECQMALEELKKVVGDKKMRHKIKLYLNITCKIFGPYEEQCDKVVGEYLAAFFRSIDNLLENPQKACSAIGFCPAIYSNVYSNTIARAYNLVMAD